MCQEHFTYLVGIGSQTNISAVRLIVRGKTTTGPTRPLGYGIYICHKIANNNNIVCSFTQNMIAFEGISKEVTTKCNGWK